MICSAVIFFIVTLACILQDTEHRGGCDNILGTELICLNVVVQLLS